MTFSCARFDLDGTVTIANAVDPVPYCDGREVEVEEGRPLGVVAGENALPVEPRGPRRCGVTSG